MTLSLLLVRQEVDLKSAMELGVTGRVLEHICCRIEVGNHWGCKEDDDLASAIDLDRDDSGCPVAVPPFLPPASLVPDSALRSGRCPF